ncbi:S8 family peptidase [Parasphaerochaeta coccoides]|uniref:Subtilisin-like serine protease n=1 Tax=Parasphaerochaeta coccoides (strain ATCC BAA-1237 / DSM 17374 / SPN1) TaxID=760011 RepID=F4GLT2_PARC1|nr:S8 family peptidase [Parasphaerochaeta coccoides]AEC02476.1 subtilisin-like serine protease [Parasphaerochaeta coccoides DSM 17374]
MNKVLELKGKFNHAPHPKTSGLVSLPKGKCVERAKLERLLQSLIHVRQYWREEQRGFRPLVSVYYTRIIPKSCRMGYILKKGSVSANSTIVGVKFSNGDNQRQHVFTHCVPLENIDSALHNLHHCEQVLAEYFSSTITAEQLIILGTKYEKLQTASDVQWKKRAEACISAHGLSKSLFLHIIKDAYYIDNFRVEERTQQVTESQIITLYDTGLTQTEILRKLQMQDEPIKALDAVTWLVNPAQYNRIISAAPYLVSMAVSDFGRIRALPFERDGMNGAGFSIPAPTTEPVIGVIDTLFDKTVYFSSWVSYVPMVLEDLIEPDDYVHGTAVSSLIVDGPVLNPHIDDGCGRFRVRHFGVAKHDRNSTADILRKIRQIVETNKDIKVWNLSLGSDLEIEQNFMSPEGALLDEIQFQNDVIFVVAGTNNRNRNRHEPRIGAPADSINSLVVNAVTITGTKVEYARRGPVLHFFKKPDVSTFGGDRQDGMVVYSSRGRMKDAGTSFAAPWIARKLAYLIHVMGFSREVAKALLLDSAVQWNTDTSKRDILGFGVVPKHISDILRTPGNEIKFIVQGVSEAYDTYTYNIPVPLNNEHFPYIAKAMLCYFPKCSLSQGVDYTDTELDIHFGRIDQKGKIYSINDNKQGDDDAVPGSQYEEKVRNEYRKWDNVKHISEGVKLRNSPRKRLSPSSPNWGMTIKKKERLENHSGQGLHFGVVVTLKEINGVNRYAEFMQLCRANGWFVNEVDIHARVNVYTKAESEVVFEDEHTSLGG